MSYFSVFFRGQISSPQLLIKSRKAPEPEGFVEHSSKINEISQRPAIVLWKNGEIKALYLDTFEAVSSKNLKRGLASILQYKTFDDEIREKDASGLCTVNYVSLGPKTILKRKSNCKINNNALPSKKQHPNSILDVKLVSNRNVTYELSSFLLPTSIKEEEEHQLTLTTRPEVGSMVTSKRLFVEIPKDNANVVEHLNANTAKHAVALLQPDYRETDIELEMEPFTCPESGCPMVYIYIYIRHFITILCIYIHTHTHI